MKPTTPPAFTVNSTQTFKRNTYALLFAGAALLFSTSVRSQSHSIIAGSLILQQSAGKTITVQPPQVGSQEYTNWTNAGSPSLQWSVPIPPVTNAVSGFVYPGPQGASSGPSQLLYWVYPGQSSSANGTAVSGGTSGTWNYATPTQLGLGGATITFGTTTPSSLSGNANNFTLDANSSYYRLDNSTGNPLDLTGLDNTGIPNGRMLTLVNTGTDPIVIKNHSSQSLGGNQFDLPGGADIILSQRGMATFIYDETSGYWELVSTN
ncbi:MAG TPA: hypothetical protein VG537_06040 [Candidatus Kapabacteria bacterium]|nr:hypothetical protein [Candidatus Kapabacteria bacterium]